MRVSAAARGSRHLDEVAGEVSGARQVLDCQWRRRSAAGLCPAATLELGQHTQGFGVAIDQLRGITEAPHVVPHMRRGMQRR